MTIHIRYMNLVHKDADVKQLVESLCGLSRYGVSKATAITNEGKDNTVYVRYFDIRNESVYVRYAHEDEMGIDVVGERHRLNDGRTLLVKTVNRSLCEILIESKNHLQLLSRGDRVVVIGTDEERDEWGHVQRVTQTQIEVSTIFGTSKYRRSDGMEVGSKKVKDKRWLDLKGKPNDDNNMEIYPFETIAHIEQIQKGINGMSSEKIRELYEWMVNQKIVDEAVIRRKNVNWVCHVIMSPEY